MRADVAEDTAVALAVEEPRGALVVVELVGAEADSVDDFTDAALADKLAGADGRARLEVLGVADRVDAAGFLLDATELVELAQARHPGLVAHDVLAVAHAGDGD